MNSVAKKLIIVKANYRKFKMQIAKLKTSDNKDLNNFVSFNRFKVLEDKKIDDKENQHNEHEDLISYSAGQPHNFDRV